MQIRSGVPLATAQGFATHQPNPRLIQTLAKQLGVAREKFPPVAPESGNLGPSTCGVALDQLLRAERANKAIRTDHVYLASLGPGLLWGPGGSAGMSKGRIKGGDL